VQRAIPRATLGGRSLGCFADCVGSSSASLRTPSRASYVAFCQLRCALGRDFGRCAPSVQVRSSPYRSRHCGLRIRAPDPTARPRSRAARDPASHPGRTFTRLLRRLRRLDLRVASDSLGRAARRRQVSISTPSVATSSAALRRPKSTPLHGAPVVGAVALGGE
jgi:hypothetical protein